MRIAALALTAALASPSLAQAQARTPETVLRSEGPRLLPEEELAEIRIVAPRCGCRGTLAGG